MGYAMSQKPTRLKHLCEESPVFRDVLFSVLRGDALYNPKTGEIYSYVKRKKVVVIK